MIRGLARFFLILVTLPLVALEDLVIRRIFRLAALLPRYIPPIQRLEAWAARRSPAQAVALLALPALLLAGLELSTTLFMVTGHLGLAGLTWVAAKAGPTILVGRILAVCHPALSHYAWFRRAEALYHHLHQRLHDFLERLGVIAVWHWLRRCWRQVKPLIVGLWK